MNIADKLIAEGLAEVLPSNNDNHQNGDGGDDRSDTKSSPKVKKPTDNHRADTEKFDEITKPINGNTEHTEDKNLKNSSASFIDNEKVNGNKVTSENDIKTIDRNSNRSYTLT